MLYLFLLPWFFLGNVCFAQNLDKTTTDKQASKLFRSEQILPIKWTYSNREINRKTNDSTYIKAMLTYKSEDGKWVDLETEIRARGGFRRLNCYYTPIKLKLKKSKTKGTLFKGNKKLKLILPCLRGKTVNDKLIKEYLAYKLYEHISPYHFKTRLVDLEYTELKGKKAIVHSLKGILQEDDKNVAERLNGREYKKNIHPLQQDAIASIQNNLFQYLIGNTDFSMRSRHNQKIFFINKKYISIPFDFDMSGLVNASYATISGIENLPIKITAVSRRLYKGYKRDELLFQEVRQDFINNKVEMFNTINSLKKFFHYPKQFLSAKQFIVEFFEILENDDLFNKKIVNRARTK